MRSAELFAKNLEALREFNGQSVAKFAQRAGVPKSTFQSVRVDGHTTLDTAIRISENLGIPLDSLAGDEHLAEKLDIIRSLIHAIDWFQASSGSDQEEIVRHFREILEVLSK